MKQDFDERRTLSSPTGATLALYRSLAEEPRGIIQINHGLAEHAARYARFARFMAGRGFHVYAHDHRGHGATVAADAPQGMFGHARAGDLVIADVEAVHDHIATEHPGLPVIAFGHSMGGLITLNFLMRQSRRVAGAAIWNTNFSAGPAGLAARALLAWERFRLGSDVPSRLMPQLTFRTWAKKVSDGRTPFDWLSRDRDEVDAYVADPLCGWDASVGMWRDVLGFVLAGADDSKLEAIRRDLPLHLVGGASDPATDGGKAVTQLERRLRRAGFSNLVSTICAETRHESLNEVNRNIIMEDFAVWASATAVLPASPA